MMKKKQIQIKKIDVQEKKSLFGFPGSEIQKHTSNHCLSP